jgi:hypothetical protein
MGREGIHKEEAMPSLSIYGCPRGLSPLLIFVPLSKNGEGEKGGEVDKTASWRQVAPRYLTPSRLKCTLFKNRALLFPCWFVINSKQGEEVKGGGIDNEKQNT